MKTKLELKTAPGSAIGTISHLLGKWEPFAEGVSNEMSKRVVKQQSVPKDEELILLWQLTYNWHIQTATEFEETECSPSPLIFGKVSLVTSSTLWEIRQFPLVIEFNGLGVIAHKKNGDFLETYDKKLSVIIAKYLSKGK